MQPVKKLATYDDLLALREGEKAEIVHGVLVVPPSVPASGAAGAVSGGTTRVTSGCTGATGSAGATNSPNSGSAAGSGTGCGARSTDGSRRA